MSLTANESLLLARASAWFDEHTDEFLAELGTWIAVPSVSDTDAGRPGEPYGSQVATLFGLVRGRAEELGFRVEAHEGHALSVLSGDQESQIGLVAHLDVVPAGDGWSFPAYEATVRDGWVVGRGVADDKGPALADLYLLRFLREIDLPLRHGLRLLLGGAEETGLTDVAHFAKTATAPVVSLVTDGGFPVNVAQKGRITAGIRFPAGEVLSTWRAGTVVNAVPATASIRIPRSGTDSGVVQLSAVGRAGHAASPEGTVNAIERLAVELAASDLLGDADRAAAAAIARVLSTPYGEGAGIAASDAVSGRLTLNGGLVEPGDGVVTLRIDIRYPVTADPAAIVAAITETVSASRGEVVDVDVLTALHFPPDDPRVALLGQVYSDVTGSEAEPYAMGGMTHSRVLPNAITFGPGAPWSEGRSFPEFIPEGHGHPHGPDEAVSVKALRQAFGIYAVAIARLDDLLS